MTKHTKNIHSLIALLSLSIVLHACGASRDSALSKQKLATIGKGTVQGDFEKTLEEAKAAWALRLDEKKLIEAIALYEKVVQIESPNLDATQRQEKMLALYVRLARAYYFLADSHTRLKASEEDEEEYDNDMMKLFDKGVTAAEKAIAVADPDFAKKIAADPGSWRTHVTKANAKALPALYWYATNLGKWALLEGITTILARKDDIKATMDHMVAKDPTYFYGAPHRYFAVYHTKVPIGGGAPDKSKLSFDKSIEIAPNYLATRVLYAQAYAPLDKKPAVFDAQLKIVLETPADIIPELTPENTLEQRKAKRLLKKKDDLFL